MAAAPLGELSAAAAAGNAPPPLPAIAHLRKEERDEEGDERGRGGKETERERASHPINSVNEKKPLHRMFRHMHGVLNEVYLQNFFCTDGL